MALIKHTCYKVICVNEWDGLGSVMIWGKINSSHVKRKGFSLKSKELTNVILELGNFILFISISFLRK